VHLVGSIIRNLFVVLGPLYHM